MKKETYEKLELEVITFENEDVITASTDTIELDDFEGVGQN